MCQGSTVFFLSFVKTVDSCANINFFLCRKHKIWPIMHRNIIR